MTDNGIVWETPPETRTPSKETWRKRLAPVVDRPGEWARVHEMSHSTAWQVIGHLRRGIKETPPGRWEFAARTNKEDPAKAFIYARYLGPGNGA